MLELIVPRALSVTAFALLIVLRVASLAVGQTAEWRSFSADQAATKYSPLDEINADNVHDLEVVWRQSTVPDATRQGNTIDAPSGSQNTPLMAGGLLFISTGFGNVAALDAATGDLVWFDPLPVADDGSAQRGVCDPRRRFLGRR